MKYQDVWADNTADIDDFVRMSQWAGDNAAVVQGGGGNTSVKLRDGRMLIKASGYRLNEITADRAFAVLEAGKLSTFYTGFEPAADIVEDEGKKVLNSAKCKFEDLPDLRPSVEAGFHAFLGQYVLHTHSVYANLATCAAEGREILARALQDFAYAWVWVDYFDPGAKLAFAIRAAMREYEAEHASLPGVIFLQNHGLIVHGASADICLQMHEAVCERLAHYFGLAPDAFPPICLLAEAQSCYVPGNTYLSERLRRPRYSERSLLEQPLYPDQQVFLADSLVFAPEDLQEGKAYLNLDTGYLCCAMSEAKSRVMLEILTAVVFISETIHNRAYKIVTLGSEQQEFIANWESEHFRKQLFQG